MAAEIREGNMTAGKMRTGNVKKVARALITTYPDKFTADYQKNKELVDELTTISSKQIRNRIAGYLARLKKMEQKSGLG